MLRVPDLQSRAPTVDNNPEQKSGADQVRATSRRRPPVPRCGGGCATGYVKAGSPRPPTLSTFSSNSRAASLCALGLWNAPNDPNA